MAMHGSTRTRRRYIFSSYKANIGRTVMLIRQQYSGFDIFSSGRMLVRQWNSYPRVSRQRWPLASHQKTQSIESIRFPFKEFQGAGGGGGGGGGGGAGGGGRGGGGWD